MRRTILVIGTLTALAGTAVAVVVDRDAAVGPTTLPRGVESARAYPVGHVPPEAAARAGVPTRGGKAGKFVYKQTKQPQTVPPGVSALEVGRCPRNSKVIGGYYWYKLPEGAKLPDTLVTDVGGSPLGTRKWVFYRSVPQPTPRGTGADPGSVENVVYGIICAKDPN